MRLSLPILLALGATASALPGSLKERGTASIQAYTSVSLETQFSFRIHPTSMPELS